MKKILFVLSLFVATAPGVMAQFVHLQNDGWYEGPPMDPFQVQTWANYFPSEFRGNMLGVVLEANPEDYPIKITGCEVLCGNDADTNVGAFAVRIYKVSDEGDLPEPGRLLWQSNPDVIGWGSPLGTSAVFLQADFQSLWPMATLPVINSGKFMLVLEYVQQNTTDIGADDGVAQVPHSNVVWYNPRLHGGTENRWQWAFAEDAGTLSRSLNHNFVIRAIAETNVPPEAPSLSSFGIGLLLLGFSVFFRLTSKRSR